MVQQIFHIIAVCTAVLVFLGGVVLLQMRPEPLPQAKPGGCNGIPISCRFQMTNASTAAKSTSSITSLTQPDVLFCGSSISLSLALSGISSAVSELLPSDSSQRSA